jgi:hypothetical protein
LSSSCVSSPKVLSSPGFLSICWLHSSSHSRCNGSVTTPSESPARHRASTALRDAALELKQNSWPSMRNFMTLPPRREAPSLVIVHSCKLTRPSIRRSGTRVLSVSFSLPLWCIAIICGRVAVTRTSVDLRDATAKIICDCAQQCHLGSCLRSRADMNTCRHCRTCRCKCRRCTILRLTCPYLIEYGAHRPPGGDNWDNILDSSFTAPPCNFSNQFKCVYNQLDARSSLY